MTTNNRHVIVELLNFMIQQYYNIVEINTPNTKFLIDQFLSVLQTSILAHKNAVPDNYLLEDICDLVDLHVKKYGVEALVLGILGATATNFNKAF